MKRLILQVRADAMTVHHLDVPAHELPILKTLFAGQVTEMDSLDDGADVPEVEGEYGRLAAKYGAGVVERVFGLPDAGGLDKALAAHKGKKTKAADAAETAGG